MVVYAMQGKQIEIIYNWYVFSMNSNMFPSLMAQANVIKARVIRRFKHNEKHDWTHGQGRD